MNQTILLTISSIFLTVQLPLLSQTYAQTPGENNNFMMRQNMAIDNRFQFLELKIDRQQKEEWSSQLFMTEASQTMKIEDIEALELTQEDLESDRPNVGIDLIEF